MTTGVNANATDERSVCGAERGEAPRAPGRPRSSRADEAIISAVIDLLSDGTQVDALSIESVAARAGVGKATIYRRWPNKEALLLDAIRTVKGPPPTPKGESVRDDLIALMSATPVDRRAANIMPCLVPELKRSPPHYRLYQEIVEERREVMRSVLRRGVASGELREDLDIELTTAMLTGPMLIQKVLRWHPGLDEQTMPAQVVDTILAGIAAR
jgi:AcrR family transcriptional regulator